jgi:SAM-dependent methyltransferase
MTDIVKPFAQSPGRDITSDRSAAFDIARFYYDQRFQIADDAAVLRGLMEAVNSPNDLPAPQWAQWYSVALGFAPDLILELGRGYGNSTALFGEAARRLGHTKVVSLCISAEWMAIASPRIVPIVDAAWFANIDAQRTDILSADYAEIIADHQRVLVLWDAHGFDIAELVLGEILPRLAGRPHLLLMHDISDNRYAEVPRSYGGQPLWKGSSWQQRTGLWNSRVNIGWMNSIQDQIIALADFSARNDVEIGSADHEYAQFFAANPAHAVEMRHRLGDELFSTVAHWAFLSLAEKTGPFHFPGLSGWRAATNRCDIVTDTLPRRPATITTDAVPWAYASTSEWRPSTNPPANVQAWIQCRVRVHGGPIGVSLETPDGRAFVQSQVASSSDQANVLLSVPDLAQRGRLVIHTWDMPVSARVQINDLSLVW